MTLSQPLCELCGEPMPLGQEMFKFHGYSGPCPKPPSPRDDFVSRGLAIWKRLDPAIDDSVGVGMASQWIAEAAATLAQTQAEISRLTGNENACWTIINKLNDMIEKKEAELSAAKELLREARQGLTWGNRDDKNAMGFRIDAFLQEKP